MNLEQFAALKPGDIIVNGLSNSRGEITTVDTTGVRVRWIASGRLGNETPTWHYSVQSTAWFHWSLESAYAAEDPAEPNTATPAGAPTA